MLRRSAGCCAARSRIIRSSISTAIGPVSRIAPRARAPPGSSQRTARPALARRARARPSGRAAVTTASVPSDPTIRRARLKAQGSAGQPTGRTGRPGTNSSRLYPLTRRSIRGKCADDRVTMRPRRCRGPRDEPCRARSGRRRSRPVRRSDIGPKRRGRAVGQNDLDGMDMVDGLAVAQATGRRPSCCRSCRRWWRGRT